MMFYRMVSALLEYPDASLREALPEIALAIVGDDTLNPEERATLAGFVETLVASDPLSAEEAYVRTFDMVPENSLHLTHHLIGEDKNRGPALVDLGEFYKSYGFEISQKELPDYLPLMLEFVSVLDAEEAKMFLSRWTKVLRQLAVNLEEAEGGYAPLVRLVEARSRLGAVADDVIEPAVASLKTNPCLDDGDFDPPVNWAAPAIGPGCSPR